MVSDPFIQTLLARIATTYLTKELKTEIKISRLEIRSFNSLRLANFLIKDHENDTLLFVGSLSVKLRQFSSKKHLIHFSKIGLSDAKIRLIKPKGSEDMNLQFVIDYFAASDTTVTDTTNKVLPVWDITIKSLVIQNSSFELDDNSKEADLGAVDFNHLGLTNLNLELQNTAIDNDTLKTEIKQLSCSEKSGFVIERFSCGFKISPVCIQASQLLLKTMNNDLDLDLAFKFKSFEDFSDFLTKVDIHSEIRPSHINLSEVGYFAPLMFAMNNNLEISGHIDGTVANFKAKDFGLTYGQNTSFEGDLQMNGLPNFYETFINLSARNLETSAEDVSRFGIPTEEKRIALPEILSKLGQIKIQGKFTGFYNDFVSLANFKTDIGTVTTDILLKVNDNKTVAYSGKLSANHFNAGILFDLEDYVETLDLSATINGSGFDFNTMKIDMDGRIDSLYLYGNRYNEIIITGNLSNKKFAGDLKVRDDNINFDFSGNLDYSTNIPGYNFLANIQDAKLEKLNLLKGDSTMNLSTRLNFNLIGNKLDNFQGILFIDSTEFSMQGESYRMKDFTLSFTRDQQDYALIRLYSDFIDASIEGNFQLVNIPVNFRYLMNQYLDTLFTKIDTTQIPATDQDFIFDINLKDTRTLSRLFMPDLLVAPETTISGGFNTRIDNIFMEGSSDEIVYKGKKFKKWTMEFNEENDKLILSNKFDKIFLSDSLNIDSTHILLAARNDTVRYSVFWKDISNKNFGDIEGFVSIFNPKKMELKIEKGIIGVNDTLWKVNRANYLGIDTNSIYFNDIGFSSKGQMIKVQGKLSSNPIDSVFVDFTDFKLTNFNPVLKQLNVELSGSINGEFKIVDFYNAPNYISDLSISDFNFNGEKLGEAVLKSNWNPEKEAFEILAEILYTGNIGTSKTLEVSGTYFPNKKKNNFDIDAKFDNYKLNTLAPFVRSFSSKITGLATGELKLTGSKNEPDLTGQLGVSVKQFKIDYLNETYSFADKINFDKNLISFDNIIVYDTLSNRAIASGKITHDHLKDFKLDLNFDMTNMNAFNLTRTQNESFYGKAIASGNLHIFGPVDNLTLDINATSDKGTSVKIPASYSSSVADNEYIVFTSPGTDTTLTTDRYNVELGGMTLNLDLNVNQDAEIQIFLPYRMGNIRGNGNGEIKMAINPKGDLTMDGEYVINKGSFFMTFQNIINRNFDIRRGSKVEWTGDPYNAQINLKAVYKLKTTLGDYGPQQDTATRVPVDCIISLTNRLFNPEIRFSIEFPDLKEDTRQYIYSRLDTNDQAMMSQQMLSLLVLNSFSHSSVSAGSVGFNTFSLVTNQINNWLSQISNDFDIGVNYRPGDQMSANEVEVALSTQLFSNRVTINGNVGVKGNETTSNTSNTSNLVGEVTVEAKITPDGRFRVKAFNLSNSDYLYKNYSPYTQGVGIFYTREFNRLSDLKITHIFSKKDKKD